MSNTGSFLALQGQNSGLQGSETVSEKITAHRLCIQS